MARLFLIDGMAMAFRAYHAMSKSALTNEFGEPTFAIFGFANILTSLFEKEEPTRAAVVFDTKAPTFRHKMYPEYKANRTDPPEDFHPQLEKIKEMLGYLGLCIIEKDGLEADDIIGTLSSQAAAAGEDTFCLTPDKDFYQLVNDHVAILKPEHFGSGITYVSYDEVKEKFGVSPEQVIDVQALLGDSVDNVPGVKGIGIKTAVPLIDKYGTVENLYEHLDEIDKKAVKTKLENGRDLAFLSKKLVTIKTDCELDFGLDDLTKEETHWQDLDSFFAACGFRSLRKKWQDRRVVTSQSGSYEWDESSATVKPKELETIECTSNDFVLLSTKEALANQWDKIKQNSFIAFDLETSSLDRNSCEIVGFSWSQEAGKAFYAPIYYPPSESGEQNSQYGIDFSGEPALNSSNSIMIDDFLDIVRDKLQSKKYYKGGQNSKFDTYILKRHGIDVSPVTFDSMLASYIIDPSQKHNLDALSEKWLGYRPVKITELIGEKKKDQKSMADLDPADVKDYACEDAELVVRLKEKLDQKIEEEKLQDLAVDLEYPMVEVLTNMEYHGITIDTDALEQISLEITETAAKLEYGIYEEAGLEFNIDSPKQLSHVLFEKMMIPPVKKTKTGYSTNVNVLSDLSKDWPIAANILEYRQLTKLKSTYTDSLPKLINPSTGRIHTTYNQTVAATGRLSSTDPNLQNIPIRTEKGKLIRKAFVACGEDYQLLSADYSQVELRLIAFISKDESLIKAFEDGLDIHAATAAGLYQKPIEEVTSDDRRVAKTVNFGIMYGIGAFGLSQRLTLERSRAKEIIDTYFSSYPGIKKYMDDTIAFTKANGYCESLFGRRRYFPDINSGNRTAQTAATRAAINHPIQGTAADMMKVAMIDIHKKLNDSNLDAKMLLQVHDELIFEVHRKDMEETKLLVKNAMEASIVMGRVPVIVDTGTGDNWLEAH
ncbi:MAG: DNA polymerase I [Candidatus Kapaibacteriales bacterium]